MRSPLLYLLADSSGVLSRPHVRQQLSEVSACSTGPRFQADVMDIALFVQTETTPNPDALKFLPGQSVSSSTHEFLTATSALPSPLATNLFNIEGVKSVFFGPDFVSVNKVEDAPWNTMKPEIFSAIIEHFTSGQPLFREPRPENEQPEDTRILDTDSEVVSMIKELLDTRVRPAIQEDGGDLEYRGFHEDSGIVELSLKGSCRGCSSSSVTLKNGIERMLMHYVSTHLLGLSDLTCSIGARSQGTTCRNLS